MNSEELEIKEERRVIKKVPANPIPQSMVEMFYYKLGEESKEFPGRNLALYKIALGTGYRMEDLTDLLIGDLKKAIENGFLEIQEKKQMDSWKTYIKKNPNSNRKPPKKRKVFIKSNLLRLLKDYTRGKRNSEYAFKSKQGGYISQKSYSEILSKIGKSLDLKHISGHSLRKTYAHRIYERTGDIEKVRINLGHKDLETTKRYLNVHESEVEKDSEIIDDMLDF